MELVILISANIATAMVIYIIFSIRFSLAVKKARKTPIINELKENIEAAIEFINTSLDLMDHKTRTFYQLVRKSEEIVKKLEESAAAIEVEDGVATGAAKETTAGAAKKSTTGAAKKRSAGAAKKGTSTPATKASRIGAALGKTKKQKIEEKEDLYSKKGVAEPAKSLIYTDSERYDNLAEYSDKAIERALNYLGDDRFEVDSLSDETESIYKKGELTGKYSDRSSDKGSHGSEKIGKKGMAAGFFERTGRFFRKRFVHSAAKENETGNDMPITSTGNDQTGKPGVSFSQVMERTRLKEEGRQLENSLGRTDKDIVMRNSLRETAGNYRDEVKAADRKANDGNSAEFADRYEPRKKIYETVESFLAADGFEDLPAAGGERNAVIRKMIEAGFTPRDISASTGITLPEVELAAALPDIYPSPRKTRRRKQ